eukprot:TRINITY_DN4141_c0_g2_i1.p1 TRINITY_DN4141_c0_g2~~TRINITY_DN4141_c0_g2_i1.p1  ORF type:complete len:268 (-),score=28.83 TRINITY_DN4141_c0_g2_i1:102-905(-)
MPFLDTFNRYLNLYRGFIRTNGDPRVENWPLMSSPLPTIILTLTYILLVPCGMKIMKNKKPFDLRLILVVHNGLLVILSLYMAIETFYQAVWVLGYGFVCNPVDYGEKGTKLARVLWVFYFSKLLEFIDTFLMVLRKKNDQITFLHIYHHAVTFSTWWIGIRFTAGGEAYVSVVQNSLVHVVMYFYYFLTALGVKNIWWKKYLTALQMIQFLVNVVHVILGLYLDSPFPRWMGWGMLIYMTSLLLLFGNFYFQAYLGKKPQHTKKDE